MRFHGDRAILFWIVFLAIQIWLIALNVEAQNAKPPLTGSQNNDHGNIEWISTAQPSSFGGWAYAHTVSNKGQMNCRVYWDVVDLKTLIPPGETKGGNGIAPDLREKGVDGTIKYNGGRAPGDGSAKASAYVPDDHKPGKCTARAEIIIESGERVFPLEIFAESAVNLDGATRSYHVTYDVRIAPAKKIEIPARSARYDVGELEKDRIKVYWLSIASKAWPEDNLTGFTRGQFAKDGELKLWKEAGEGQPLLMAGTVPAGNKPPQLVSKSIRFVIGTGNDQIVVGSALLPAYSPQ